MTEYEEMTEEEIVQELTKIAPGVSLDYARGFSDGMDAAANVANSVRGFLKQITPIDGLHARINDAQCAAIMSLREALQETAVALRKVKGITEMKGENNVH